MASMAAAIASSRTAASGGSGGNRPLDERERKRFTYFSSLNPMARKIMQEKERIRERAGPAWERMQPGEQEQLIDRCLVDPQLQARYALHRRAPPEPQPLQGGGEDGGGGTPYPSLRLDTGQKVVHFGEEDITWQDEHSAPFSWETRSQMEFSVASLPAQEQSVAPLLPTEPRQPSKAVPGIPASKVSHGTQPTKPSQGSKTPNMDGPVPSRKEEESTFWKISAERSKIDGQEAGFQSLTPSQIKSLEKGEKSLPPYYRQESGSKDKEAMRVEKPAVNKQDKQTTQSFPPVTSPSKASAAYPSVVSAAYPSAASTVSPSKATAAYPIVTSAPYPAATSSGVTTASYASKATAAYTSDYSATPSGASTAAHPNMAFAATPNVTSVTVDYEKPRPNQSAVSSMDDVFLPKVAKQTVPVSKTILNGAEIGKDDSSLPDQQRLSEINTSNVVLKTGFDFLDNW